MVTAMRALQLDYQHDCKPMPWAGVAVLVAALATLALMGGHFRTLDQQIALWEGKLDRVERLSRHRSPAARPLTEQAARARMLEFKQANQVVRQLSLPWSALFKAVETTSGQNIALLSLAPDPGKGTVIISGEARDLDALLNYTRQLSTRDIFGSVMLQNHQIQQSDPEKPLRFSLLAEWKGVAP
jgi:hypothetical protein